MKRTVSIILSVIILLFSTLTASASGAGTSTDYLISRSYFEDSFLKSALEQGTSRAVKSFLAEYELANNALDEMQDSNLLRAGGKNGFQLTGKYKKFTLVPSKTVTVLSGTSVVVNSGTVTVSISRGSVINISTGKTVSSGSVLTNGIRYFCAENTVASLCSSENYVISVDGWVNALAGSTALTFKDVPQDKWYYNAVSFVVGRELFNGVSDTQFAPESPMTRAMFVTVLYRLAGEPYISANSVFSDVTDSTQWYYKAVCWASSKGIVEGYGDGLFKPNDNITREQMALIMYKYVKFKDISVSVSGTSAFSSFSDSASVSSWAKDALIWATDKGIINGSDGKLMPKDTASRAQVAQIIKNCCDAIPEI